MTLRRQPIDHTTQNVSFIGDRHGARVAYPDLHGVAGLARLAYLGMFVDVALARVKERTHAC